MDQLKKEDEISETTSSGREEHHQQQPENVSSEPYVKCKLQAKRNSLEIEIQEQMQCIFDKDGGLSNLDIMGLFAVNATQEEATRVQLVVNSLPDVQFRVRQFY
jgi:hypothetical protein